MHTDVDSVLASVVERLAEAGGVGSVYGDPVERDDRTVIPVARVAWGFGGGGGSGPADAEREDGEGDEPAGEGYGMGGGVSASPAGALEITDDGTRFVRYESRKRLVVAVLLAFLAGVLLGRR
ncbi:spore germination protein GerW family protein [Halobacterium litoreum]|uniref:Spore germination protein GerW family protein n=1 Tax=Halobacterium litoreum TaxID=2039234 RepID=A0ABD5NEM1_9EURY|nr:spore germination protein GerW family protein [Halobacterium litoreum]UHH13419.1 hypothetical protein LT972_00125 [Halobacterium litoreum]